MSTISHLYAHKGTGSGFGAVRIGTNDALRIISDADQPLAQESGNLATLADTTGTLDNAAPSSAVLCGGKDGSGDLRALSLDSSGNLSSVGHSTTTASTSWNGEGTIQANEVSNSVDIQTSQSAIVYFTTDTAGNLRIEFSPDDTNWFSDNSTYSIGADESRAINFGSVAASYIRGKFDADGATVTLTVEHKS